MGCVVLLLCLIVAIIAPPIGIPLLLVVLAVMLLTGAGRAMLGLGRTVAKATAPPEQCPVCGEPITDPATAVTFQGKRYHGGCWKAQE